MSISGRYRSPPRGRDSPPGGVAADGMTCERCENKRGVLECTNCDALYCLECSTVVHQGRMAQHKLAIVDEICVRCEENKGTLQCLDCKGSKYTLYCLECHSLVHQGRIARHMVKVIFGHEVPGFMGSRDSQMESSDFGRFGQPRDRYSAHRDSPDPDRGYHSNSRSPQRGVHVHELSPYHSRHADTHSRSTYRSRSRSPVDPYYESRVAAESERFFHRGASGDRIYESRSPNEFPRGRSQSPADIPHALSPVRSYYPAASPGQYADDRARSPSSYFDRVGVESSVGYSGRWSRSPSPERQPSQRTFSSHSHLDRYQSRSPSPDNQSLRDKRKYSPPPVHYASTLGSPPVHKRARSRSPSPYASGSAHHSSETSVHAIGAAPSTIVSNQQQHSATGPMPTGYSQPPPAQTGYPSQRSLAQTGYPTQTSTQSSYPVQPQAQPGYPAYPQGQSGYPAQPPAQGGYPGYPGTQYGHPQTTSGYPGQLQTAYGYPVQPQIQYRYPVQPQAGPGYPVSNAQGVNMYGIQTVNYPPQQAGSMYPVPPQQGLPGFPRPPAQPQYTYPVPLPQVAPGFPRPPAPAQYTQSAPGFPRPPAPQQYIHPGNPPPQQGGAHWGAGHKAVTKPTPQPRMIIEVKTLTILEKTLEKDEERQRKLKEDAAKKDLAAKDAAAKKAKEAAAKKAKEAAAKKAKEAAAKKAEEAAKKEASKRVEVESKCLQVSKQRIDKMNRHLNSGQCPLCSFQVKELHVHIVREHVPWYTVGSSACWQCQVFVHVLDADEHKESKGHKSTGYDMDDIVKWGYLICGSLHFLARKFKCETLLELREFVLKYKLYPVQPRRIIKTFSNRERHWFIQVGKFFPELLTPGRNGGPDYCSPPKSIFSLMNWTILCRMLGALDDDKDRLAFLSYCKPLRPDGSEIEDLKVEIMLRRSGVNTGSSIKGAVSDSTATKKGADEKGTNKEGGSMKASIRETDGVKEIVVPYSPDKNWIFKTDGAVCETCRTSSDRTYIHKVVSHLPWFAECKTACWNCESQEISKVAYHCELRGHPLNFCQDNKIQWVYLTCGSLHFLAEKFNCSSLEELLVFVRKHRLFPEVEYGTGFTEAVTNTLLFVERYFPKLAEAGRIQGALRVSPPTSILCLSDYRILCCLLTALGKEDQERFRSHVALTSVGGRTILFPDACIPARIKKYTKSETESQENKLTEQTEAELMDEGIGENPTNESTEGGVSESGPTTKASTTDTSAKICLKRMSIKQEKDEEICGSSKAVSPKKARKTTWSFSRPAILCDGCRVKSSRHKHKLEFHLPWWFEGRNACWLCEDSGTLQSGCCHTQVADRDQVNTIRWGLLFFGAMHFLAEKFHCNSLLELLQFVRKRELYPTQTKPFEARFTKQTCSFLGHVEDFFPELAAPGRLPGPLTHNPPTSILCLSEYKIICQLLTGLSGEDRLIFRTFRISKTPDGTFVTDIAEEIEHRQEMYQKRKNPKEEEESDTAEAAPSLNHDRLDDDLQDSSSKEIFKDTLSEYDKSLSGLGVEDGSGESNKTSNVAMVEQDKKSTRIINDKEDGTKDDKEEEDRVSEGGTNNDMTKPENDAAKDDDDDNDDEDRSNQGGIIEDKASPEQDGEKDNKDDDDDDEKEEDISNEDCTIGDKTQTEAEVPKGDEDKVKISESSAMDTDTNVNPGEDVTNDNDDDDDDDGDQAKPSNVIPPATAESETVTDPSVGCDVQKEVVDMETTQTGSVDEDRENRNKNLDGEPSELPFVPEGGDADIETSLPPSEEKEEDEGENSDDDIMFIKEELWEDDDFNEEDTIDLTSDGEGSSQEDEEMSEISEEEPTEKDTEEDTDGEFIIDDTTMVSEDDAEMQVVDTSDAEKDHDDAIMVPKDGAHLHVVNTIDTEKNGEDLGEVEITSDAATETSTQAVGMNVEEAIDQHLQGDTLKRYPEKSDTENSDPEKGDIEKIDPQKDDSERSDPKKGDTEKRGSEKGQRKTDETEKGAVENIDDEPAIIANDQDWDDMNVEDRTPIVLDEPNVTADQGTEVGTRQYISIVIDETCESLDKNNEAETKQGTSIVIDDANVLSDQNNDTETEQGTSIVIDEANVLSDQNNDTEKEQGTSIVIDEANVLSDQNNDTEKEQGTSIVIDEANVLSDQNNDTETEKETSIVIDEANESSDQNNDTETEKETSIVIDEANVLSDQKSDTETTDVTSIDIVDSAVLSYQNNEMVAKQKNTIVIDDSEASSTTNFGDATVKKVDVPLEKDVQIIGESSVDVTENETNLLDDQYELDNVDAPQEKDIQIIDESSIDVTKNETNLLDDQYETESNESGQMLVDLEILDECVGSDDEEDP